MTRAVVPMNAMDRRMVEHGRIRTGEKKGKAMVALKTFRFTSSDHAAIEQIAALYGGVVKPFKDGRTANQLDVTTESTEIKVVLPPDPLSGTPVYELWSAGGCQRRCDGETCEVPKAGPEGIEFMPTDCICTATKKLECKPITRLNVVLPEIRFGGSWRLESKGWNSAKELPGMVDMIQRLQASGMTVARLALVERTSTLAGKTRKFIVPVLRVDESVEAIASGDARLRGTLVQGEVRELGSGDDRSDLPDPGAAGSEPVGDGGVEWEGGAGPELDQTGPESDGGGPQQHGGGPDVQAPAVVDADDEDIVDAEIVEDPLPLVIDDVKPKQLQRIAIMCKELGWDDDKRHALALSASHGRVASTRELTEDERLRLIEVLKQTKRGVWEWAGVDEEGKAKLLRMSP